MILETPAEHERSLLFEAVMLAPLANMDPYEYLKLTAALQGDIIAFMLLQRLEEEAKKTNSDVNEQIRKRAGGI